MAIEAPFVRVGCGNFILTNSIAFFYPLGLTSIVTLQKNPTKILPARATGRTKEYNGKQSFRLR